MFCPKCGSQLPDDAKFCGVCGATIENVENQNVDPTPAAPVGGQPAGGQNPYPNQNPYGPQGGHPGYPGYPSYPQRRPMNFKFDLNTILYMVAAFFHLMALIFWWIPSANYGWGDKASLFKVFTESKSTFPAVLIIIFLIVGLCITAYYAGLDQITKEPLKKFNKILKLAIIDMHMLIVFATMTIMGPYVGNGVTAGFPIVFIYISLFIALACEAVAYFFTEKTNK